MCKVIDVFGNFISKENKSNMVGKFFLMWVNLIDVIYIFVGIIEDSFDLLEDFIRRLVNMIDREKNFYFFDRKVFFI